MTELPHLVDQRPEFAVQPPVREVGCRGQSPPAKQQHCAHLFLLSSSSSSSSSSSRHGCRGYGRCRLRLRFSFWFPLWLPLHNSRRRFLDFASGGMVV